MKSTQSQKSKVLFAWRHENTAGNIHPGYLAPARPEVCPACATHLAHQKERVDFERFDFKTASLCPLCGWADLFVHENEEFGLWESTVSVLREFDINSPQVAFRELGSHLRTRSGDLYDLHWRRFEELVGDVFREHGFRVVLTAPTKDGGADLLLLAQDGGLFAIVECKKYAEHRRIGVDLVRTLVGAAVDWQVRDAYLVTSSEPALDAVAKAQDFARSGYRVTLIGASTFLELLGAYNHQMPRLDRLTDSDREQIIQGNRTILRTANWFDRAQFNSDLLTNLFGAVR